jgi:hypothetical protein
VAIVYAAKVDGLYATGDYARAVETSGKAKQWLLISVGLGILAAIGYTVLILGGVLNNSGV